MINIPFSTLPDFSETITLDNAVWVLRFQWNSKFSFWSMSIGNATGVIVDGIRLVPDLLLLQCHGKDNLPAGDFLIFSPNATSAPIGRNNLGQTHDFRLYYLTAGEADGFI